MVSILPIELNSLIQGYLGETLHGLPMKYAQYHSGRSVPKVNGDHLKVLDISYPCKNMDRISSLHSLEKLTVKHCGLSEIPNMASLKELMLDDCYFDSSKLGKLDKLEKLTILGSSYVDLDLSFLNGMKSLRELGIFGHYRVIMPDMKEMISLRKLHLETFSIGNIVKNIPTIPFLEDLRIDANMIDDMSSISHFKYLKKLNIDWCSPADLDWISSINLEKLIVRDGRFLRIIPEKLESILSYR